MKLCRSATGARRGVAALLAVAGIGLALPAAAFEVKGITPGMDASGVDFKRCQTIPNADSGVPGYRCDTTVGGEKAVVNIGVFNGSVVLAVFKVERAMMGPTKEALTEKYGLPSQRNRFIESYDWRSGGAGMTIKENKLARGFDILLVDWTLFEQAQQALKEKAKTDL